MRHGEPRHPAFTPADDPELYLGLSMSIEEFMERFPCTCEALCTCDKEEPCSPS